ncbi:hypothetical protein DH2020_004598 [Rehmannia glutinosa]|uniref:CCT domain-containing protein n=1 Tax=Rehmannia glutinosa TaxID=99300 RepID=A0ABR0XPY1_REHGL
MLQDMVHPQDQQLSIDEITSPLGAHILEFCESELFPETLQNSEVASSSNCCYEEHSSYPSQPTITTDMNKYNTTTTDNEINPPPPPITTTTTAAAPSSPTAAQNTNLGIIFEDTADDQLENDISASIDFTDSPPFSVPHHHQYLNNNNNNNNSIQEPFNINPLNNHLSLGDHMVNGSLHQYAPERWATVAAPPSAVVPVLVPPLTTSYEEECLPSVPSYIRLRPSQTACSLMDTMMPPFLPQGNMNAPFSAESSGIFTGGGGLMLGNHQELDFEGDNAGLFLPDNIPRVFNCSNELQTLSSEGQHLVHGGTSTAPLGSEISSLDDPTFKVGKLSVEERKRKIHRYLKKRNERNFSKKIKYACRKTLADSRPRVRGRFAKNDELGEIGRTNGNNHEDDTDEDVTLFPNSNIPDHRRKVAVKEEDDMDSDIFAHISGQRDVLITPFLVAELMYSARRWPRRRRSRLRREMQQLDRL